MRERLDDRLYVHILEEDVVEAVAYIWQLFNSRLRDRDAIVPRSRLIFVRSLNMEHDSVDVGF